MKCWETLRKFILNLRRHLKNDSVESILWLINLVPSMLGCTVFQKNISASFWILHSVLLFYVYGLGSFVYLILDAQGIEDFVKSYVNLSILTIIITITYWLITKRHLLKNVLKKINESDELSRHSAMTKERHRRLLSVIKKIVLIFLGFNFVDAYFIYLPNRVSVSNNYCMTPCVGIKPLTSSPKREMCLTILFTQEMTVINVGLYYQGILLFLIAHTAVMYQMLTYDMTDFDTEKNKDNLYVNEQLLILVRRHSLTLGIIDDLKSLYSVPIGINFGSNAVCICIFFYLPLQEWIKFLPILLYCFLVFFLYCYLCQRIVNAAEDFERAIYCCGWENFGLREMKIVYFMLLQAQKPVQLLAADIIPVNIYTFATTMQAMYKFTTVVKT